MPPRGCTTSQPGTSGGRQQRRGSTQPETPVQRFERLWLSTSCADQGTLGHLSKEQLAELQSAMAAVQQWHQQSPAAAPSLACSPATFLAAAQLVALAAHGLLHLRTPRQPRSSAEILSGSDIGHSKDGALDDGMLYFTLMDSALDVLNCLAPQNILGHNHSLPSPTQQTSLVATVLLRMQVPHLMAALQSCALALPAPTVGSPSAASACAAQHQEQVQSEEGVELHSQLEQLMFLQQGLPISLQLVVSGMCSRQRAVVAFSRGPLLDHLVRTSMSLADEYERAWAGASDDANPFQELVAGYAASYFCNVERSVDNVVRMAIDVARSGPGLVGSCGRGLDAPWAPVATAAGGSAAYRGSLQRLGMACWDQPLERLLLAAPGMQFWAAARMVQALCAADGGPSWGMPHLVLPLPDVQQLVQPSLPDAPPAERAVAFIVLAAPVLAAGLCQRMAQRLQQGSNGSPQGRAAGSDNPMQPGSTYRIAMRSLEWALPAGAQQARAGPSSAAATPLPLPRAMRASPYALHVAHHALPLAVLAARAGAANRAENRLLALLPHVVGVLAAACDDDAPPSSALVRQSAAALNALQVLCDVTATSSDMCARCVIETTSHGLLPALQAAVAWLTPEREQQQQKRPRLACLEEVGQPPGSALAVPLQQATWRALRMAPYMRGPSMVRAQAAALVASVRSSLARRWQAAIQPGCADSQLLRASCARASQDLHQNLVKLYSNGPLAEPTTAAPLSLRTLGAFMLKQWAPIIVRATVAATAVRARQGGADGAGWSMVLTHIALAARACSRSAAAAAAAAAPAAVADVGGGDDGGAASWRCFLLRDLRALDALGLMLRVAAFFHAERATVEQVLDTLHAVCHALPRDVQRHLEAGRAQPPLSLQQAATRYMICEQTGRCSAAQAAGCGLAWLRLDAPTRALLGNRPELLVFLEGASTQVTECAGSSRSELAAAVFAAPYEATALLPTCDNPACTAQACYLPAGRGGPPPALQPCAKCGQAHYCSKGCQKAHWDAYHKFECGQGWWAAVGGGLR